MSQAAQPASAPARSYAAGSKRSWQLEALVLLGLVAWLYSSIINHLVKQWWHDPNFSHGFFVPAFSAFLIWQKRSRLRQVVFQPSFWGLAILVFALLLLVIGVFGAELFLSRVSLLILLSGMTVFFLGWHFFRELLFPWAFLFLMIPIPALIFNQITFPLQLLVSRIAAVLLPLAGVPVLREGNIINLSVMPLEVAQACSGIRSLISLITLAVMYGYLFERRVSVRVLLACASVPIAIAANSLRILGTGVLVQYWGARAAEGFFHTFSGWLVFVVSLLMIFALHKMLSVCFYRQPGTA